jgi:organic hydroperoxide reductase OsmC/OhrA
MSVVYVAEAIASGYGRSGHVETVDGRLIVDLERPAVEITHILSSGDMRRIPAWYI